MKNTKPVIKRGETYHRLLELMGVSRRMFTEKQIREAFGVSSSTSWKAIEHALADRKIYVCKWLRAVNTPKGGVMTRVFRFGAGKNVPKPAALTGAEYTALHRARKKAAAIADEEKRVKREQREEAQRIKREAREAAKLQAKQQKDAEKDAKKKASASWHEKRDEARRVAREARAAVKAKAEERAMTAADAKVREASEKAQRETTERIKTIIAQQPRNPFAVAMAQL
jgi:flagellar biosynthesis GTPase FlhF